MATLYCGPSNTGNGSGGNFSNLLALPNTTGFTRGNTYIIVDGSYGSKTLSTATSGSTTITIKKASAADSGVTGYAASLHDGQAVFTGFNVNTAYWTIDGMTRDEADWADGDAYGIKIDTTGGTNPAINALWQQVGHFTIRYVYILGSGPDDSAGDNVGVYIRTNYAGPLYSMDTFLIERNFIYDMGYEAFFISGCTNGVIQYNYLWKNESTPAQHSEEIALEYSSNGWDVRHNVFRECEGTCFVLAADSSNVRVYGNIFMDSEWMGNGVFDGWSHTPMGTGCTFHNNTVVNVGNPRIGAVGGNATLLSYNNLFLNWTTDDPAFSGTDDYNGFSGSDAFGEAHAQTGLTTAIFVNYAGRTTDFRNLKLASATNAGTTLASPYTTDLEGTTRGASGVWDRGAYEYPSGGSSPPTGTPVLSVR